MHAIGQVRICVGRVRDRFGNNSGSPESTPGVLTCFGVRWSEVDCAVLCMDVAVCGLM